MVDGGRARRTRRAAAFTEFCTLRDRLTVAQRAFARVAYDGLDPEQLEGAERERAHEIFGPVERFPANTRRVLVQVKGRDVGGTRLAAERVAHLALTLPIDRIGLHEVAYAVFGGPKLRHARVGLRHARAALRAHGVTIQNDSRDGFTITRHDGRVIRFEAFAASRGGDTVRGVPIVAALLDEAGFYYDESNVANGEAVFGAITPRLLPGGQVLIVSSPWAESGLLYTEFSRNHGHPVTAMAALCPTPLMRDDPETLAMVAQEYERDRENAERELGAGFMAAGSGYYFDSFAIGRSAVDSVPLRILPPHPKGWTVVAGYDPAYVRDAAEGVIVRADGQRYEVVELFTRIPEKGQPLIPSEVDQAFAERLLEHGGRVIATDQHYRESVRENVSKFDVRLVDTPGGNAGKCEVFGRARDLIHADRVRWCEGHRRLTRQAREVIGKPLAGGLLSISSPRRRGDHGDAVHALALALWAGEKALADADPLNYTAIAVGSERGYGGKYIRILGGGSELGRLSFAEYNALSPHERRRMFLSDRAPRRSGGRW